MPIMQIPESKNYADLIVLCGPPRSGTTWLNRELCNAFPASPMLPECSLITQQIMLYHNTLHYCDRPRFQAYFDNQQNLASYFRASITNLINLVSDNQQLHSHFLILKDPELCLYLEDIKDLIPSHKLIVLVRDPRDVLASMKSVSLRKNQVWDVQDASKWLYLYYSKIDEHVLRSDKNCLFLRYEDIVVEGVETLKKFLRTSFTGGDAIDVAEETSPLCFEESDPFFSDFYLQPTTSTRIGSYSQALSKMEIFCAECLFSGVMQRWGYVNMEPIKLWDRFTRRKAHFLCKKWLSK
jgi:Sulfotransferase family